MSHCRFNKKTPFRTRFFLVGSKNMMIFEEIEIHLSSPQERLKASGSKKVQFSVV